MDLLLVEDDDVLAASLAKELVQVGHSVAIAEDGREALKKVAGMKLDAVILDRMLPHVDGLSVLRWLREEGLTVPVIMLTALGKLSDKIEGLQEGADDYVVKPVDVAELDARLAAVTRGRSWTVSDSDTISAGDIVINPQRHRVWRDGVAVELSKVELTLLAELVRNAGSVLSRTMLLERVWNYDFEPKANIVEMTVRRIRQKLMASEGEDPIVTVRGVGYMVRA